METDVFCVFIRAECFGVNSYRCCNPKDHHRHLQHSEKLKSNKPNEFVPQPDLLWKMFLEFFWVLRPQEKCKLKYNSSNTICTFLVKIIFNKIIALWKKSFISLPEISCFQLHRKNVLRLFVLRAKHSETAVAMWKGTWRKLFFKRTRT